MKKIVYLFSLAVFVLSCKDTTDDGPIIPDGQDMPIGVELIFPYEDSLCNEGENPTPTESTVNFEWEPNNNAESYTLFIENLTTAVVMQFETDAFIFPVTIDRADAFRWYVEYNQLGETRTSEVWNFYNSGPGIQTYAPFPAEIISPIMAQIIPTTTSVTLEWSGSDVDDDIVGYDVYFGVINPPNIVANNITATQMVQSVTAGTTYYWNIVTKDAEGNTSESGIHQFNIQN